MPDRLRRSRMELRLEGEIAASSSLQAACKRAELASCRARLGRFSQARAELDALHREWAHRPHVQLSAWTHLAEGLFDHFTGVRTDGTDRVRRAHALCIAGDLTPLRAICAGWLAQWACAGLDMDRLALHVREALHHAGPQHHVARSRATLVAAQALNFAGRMDLAQPWYRRSQDHATDDGDDVTISALMHNRAWQSLLGLRQFVLTGEGDVNIGRYALANAESTAHFDDLIGDVSWQELRPILRAQIFSLQGDAAQAGALYDAHLPTSKPAVRTQANLLADHAWCHIRMGRMQEAVVCADESVANLDATPQIDNLAAAHSLLARVFAALGDAARNQSHQALADQCWARLREAQVRAVELLGSLDENGALAPV
ncbi:MAG: hypothetical protein ABIQ60_12605 [Burkholderiaceae bacterium]